MTDAIQPANDRELVLSRVVAVSRAALWRGWTEPALMREWFCPKPWYADEIVLDLRVGGASSMVIKGPNGEAMPNHGVYLEVIPERKLVFTDAFTAGWMPSEKPFFTGIIELEDVVGGTRYTARARHWTVADREQHEQMGFHEGWGIALDQLVALVGG